ncbi:MAG: fumarylacetoacetate hydrolase family protein [Rhodospirillales bacterium]|nr:fumarylacetoacetate hydrolase family protein [Rhodospirillales bacterium]
MNARALEKAATYFAAMRRSGIAAAPAPVAMRPPDIAAGYDLQAAAGALLSGEKGAVCGFKIGCTTAVMQEFLNIDHPCAGLLYEKEVHPASVTLRLADFVQVGVECEIALRLASDLAPQATPFTRQSVAGAVGAVMAAAEIVDNRYQDYHAFGIPALIADDFFSAGAVIGPGCNPADVDLEKAVGITRIDGQQVGSGLGAAVMGHPLNALAWLANQKAERSEGLKAGDLIMTGSVVATQWIDGPCVVSCTVLPLGAVQISFI